MRCAVAGCHTDYQSKNYTSDLMFFRFPKDDENLSRTWVNACKLDDKINVKNGRICSKHFDKDCYERNVKFELLGYSARNRRLLKQDALPTLIYLVYFLLICLLTTLTTLHKKYDTRVLVYHQSAIDYLLFRPSALESVNHSLCNSQSYSEGPRKQERNARVKTKWKSLIITAVLKKIIINEITLFYFILLQLVRI
ncbi:hypothetical protein RI129_007662 [Pyrocoelia pectoralis]|uniref:THAP-type domain-containing protein n=1 Tax=Pyrocoelia pectoralis TaxID=417401 RepID=A0AAN7ZH79_9COLE